MGVSRENLRPCGSLGCGGHKEALATMKELAIPNVGRGEPSFSETHNQDPQQEPDLSKGKFSWQFVERAKRPRQSHPKGRASGTRRTRRRAHADEAMSAIVEIIFPPSCPDSGRNSGQIPRGKGKGS